MHLSWGNICMKRIYIRLLLFFATEEKIIFDTFENMLEHLKKQEPSLALITVCFHFCYL